MSSINDNFNSNDNKKKRRLITLGNCSRFNLFILGSAIFKLLSLFILGDDGKKIGMFGFCPLLCKYISMQSLYTYVGYIIIGIIWYAAKKRKKMIKIISGSFIYNNPEFSKNTKKTNFYFFLVCFFFYNLYRNRKYIIFFRFPSFELLDIRNYFFFFINEKIFRFQYL